MGYQFEECFSSQEAIDSMDNEGHLVMDIYCIMVSIGNPIRLIVSTKDDLGVCILIVVPKYWLI